MLPSRHWAVRHILAEAGLLPWEEISVQGLGPAGALPGATHHYPYKNASIHQQQQHLYISLGKNRLEISRQTDYREQQATSHAPNVKSHQIQIDIGSHRRHCVVVVLKRR